MPDMRSRERGFTLVEALVAMVILSVGLMAISQLFYVATGSNQMANKGTATTTQATEVLERLKAIPFRNLAAGGALSGGNPSSFCTGGAPPCVDDGVNDCVVPGNFIMCKDSDTLTPAIGVDGVGPVVTRWQIQLADSRLDTAGVMRPSAYFITVQSRIEGALGGPLTQAQFSTLRACTGTGCP